MSTRFDGVLQILRYNVHFYLASVLALLAVAALFWLQLLPKPAQAVLAGGAGLVVFWSLTSLAASYYVYDYAGVTRWDWVPRMLLFPPRQWANIHAGLDQSTQILTQLFPEGEPTVLDIYDPREMTEPSIERARQLHPSGHPAVPSKLHALPLPDRGRDTLFLLFVAHEIREPARRIAFFQEAARVLTVPGQIVLVEHLRDWKNFVAFGPGFLHFYSRREWSRVAAKAGLQIEHEAAVTPFVRCFVMTRFAA